MNVKTKDPIKLDQILKLLFSTSERVLLDTLTSIFNIKLKGKELLNYQKIIMIWI